jgi:hypothetical protein
MELDASEQKDCVLDETTPAPVSRFKITKLLLWYALFFFTFVSVRLITLIPNQAETPTLVGIQVNKLAFYRAHKNEFNLVFLGDSRTYTDIRSDIIDADTHRHSISLASFGLWLPVQYLQFRDVLPIIPPHTTVVWSLSHISFQPIGDRWWIPGQYDFPFFTAIKYIFEGYPFKRIIEEYEQAPYSPIRHLTKVYNGFLTTMDTVLWQSNTANTNVIAANTNLNPPTAITKHYRAPTETEIQKVTKQWQSKKYIIDVKPVKDGDLTTSLEALTDGGSYIRIELIPQYFKDKTASLSTPQKNIKNFICNYQPNPVYWATFLRMLRLAKENNINLIVNRVEDNPSQFTSVEERDCYRNFMNTVVKTTIEKYGFRFLSLDSAFNQLKDTDYFDPGHLNSVGDEKYSNQLGPALASMIATEKK